MDININSYIPKTEVEGPGARFCIWVQGCSIRCYGCANSHMWNFDGGKIYEVSQIVEIISGYKNEIEGLTFFGGEPLDQIDAVIEISKKVKDLGLTVLVFTGYDYESIKDNVKIKELVNHIDVLIDGKYDMEKQDFSRPWVGSSNQNYYFFSDNYNESIITEYKNKFEIRCDNDNKVTINGMGNYSKVTNLVR